jgi:hypothetical protein
MATITIVIDHDDGAQFMLIRELDIAEVAKTNDTIISNLLSPTMAALDGAATRYGVPAAEWTEQSSEV